MGNGYIDSKSVRSGNFHTLTITTPVALGGKTTDYEDLTNKPSINGEEVSGDKDLSDYGLPEGPLSEDDIDRIIGSASSEETLRELIAEGGELELNKTIFVTEPISVVADVVLDLNGHILTYEGDEPVFEVYACELVLKNGMIQAKHIANVTGGGTIRIESGEYTAEDVCFTAHDESELIFNGGYFTANNKCFEAFDNACVTVNDGTFVPPIIGEEDVDSGEP